MEIKEGVAVANSIRITMATSCLICNESIEIDKYVSNKPVFFVKNEKVLYYT